MIKRLFFLLFTLPILVWTQQDSINVDGMERYYYTFIPSEMSTQNSVALIVALHGGVGSGTQLEIQSQLSVLAEQEKFIVVYPDGFKNALGIRTWNAGVCCGSAVNQNIDDVSFISLLIEKHIETFNVDPEKVFITGMSNGGFMAYRLACEIPEKIAAIAPVACSMNIPNGCNASQMVPIIHFHSFLDSNIPYNGGHGDGLSNHYNPPLDSVFNVWSDIGGCINRSDTIISNEYYTQVHFSSCSCEREIQYLITEDGGHSWPGGQATAFGDDVSEYINANLLMWTFFQTYQNDPCSQSIYQPTFVSIQLENQIVKLDQVYDQVKLYNMNGQLLYSFNNIQNIDLNNKNLSEILFLVIMDNERIECKKLLNFH